MNGEAGKGDTYRKVDGKKMRENYDRIFGQKEDCKKGWISEKDSDIICTAV